MLKQQSTLAYLAASCLALSGCVDNQTPLATESAEDCTSPAILQIIAEAHECLDRIENAAERPLDEPDSNDGLGVNLGGILVYNLGYEPKDIPFTSIFTNNEDSEARVQCMLLPDGEACTVVYDGQDACGLFSAEGELTLFPTSEAIVDARGESTICADVVIDRLEGITYDLFRISYQ